ncbi:MAG: methylmalonyl-CoA mutase family protein [Verrucomicrobiota bacterium]
MTTAPESSAAAALAEGLARWRKTVESELKGVPFEKKLVTRTPEGVALQPLYTRADLSGLESATSAAPGAAPFLRGTHATGYKQSAWEIAQEIAAASPVEFNRLLLADLMKGQDSVVLPAGASCYRREDLEVALKDVALDALPVHLAAGVRAGFIADAYLDVAAARGFDLAKLTGSVTLDPFAAWVRCGSLVAPLDDLFDDLAAWVKRTGQTAPALRTIGIDATPWADAGASATQELACALAAGTAVLKALAAREVTPAEAAAKLRVTFAVGPQFFTEIAKFRAFRLLWSRVLSGFGVELTPANMPSVNARTGRWNKTLHDAHVNMLRVTTESLSAVLGGVDSLHIAPFNEVAGVTDDISRRIARNVHTLLAEEFGFTATADPAGGSWYVEKLTDQLARQSWKLFAEIEAAGGLAAALRAGLPQRLVNQVAADKAAALDTRRTGLIGTNLFPNLNETPLAPAPTADHRRGFIGCDVIAALTPVRASEPFEQLRAAARSFEKTNGQPPRVFLAKMGPVKQHKPRADFTAGFFSVGGFKAVGKDAFTDAAEAAKAAAISGAQVAVLCSTDDTYPELAPVFAKSLRAAAPGVTIILAGQPADETLAAAYRAAGFEDFIHVKSNVRATLATQLKKIGAL